MTTSQFPSYSGQQPPPASPAKPKSRGLLRKVGIPAAAFLIGVGIGSAGGGSDTASTASPATATATATATVTAPAPPAPAAPAPVTVTAPAVTITAAPPPPPEPAGPASSFDGDGTFVVGEDIAPGTYRNAGSTSGCYWARLSGLSGGFSDIITNGFGEGQAVVQISADDAAFETRGCGEWAQR